MKKHLKDFFIPHEGNEFKPHSLQKIAVTGMVAMVLLSFTFANLQSILWITSDWMVSTVLPAVVVDLTNDERTDAALNSLRRNETLDAAARMKAQHMAQNEYFAHFSPDGVSPWYWFAQANYNFVHAGENLAIHFTDSGEVVDAWMDSPTHRANIMNGSYTEIGVGTAEGMYDGFRTVYVVQLFGTPAAQPTVAGTQVAQAAEPAPAPLAEPEPEPTPEPAEVAVALEAEEESVVLAEEVAITEEVEIVPAEPVPVTVTKVATNTPEQPVVAEIEVTDTGVALFSDHVSTSTGAIPASTLPEEPQSANEALYFFEVLTQPHLVLQMLYVVIGIFVLASLIISILVEIKRQHPVQIAYSLALLVLMTGLFYVHSMLTAGAVVV